MGERRILGCCWGQKDFFFVWSFWIGFLGLSFYFIYFLYHACVVVWFGWKLETCLFTGSCKKQYFLFICFCFRLKDTFSHVVSLYTYPIAQFISLWFCCLFVGGLLFLYALLVQNGKCTVKTKHIKTEKYTLGFRDTHVKIEDTPGKYSFFRLSILRCKIMCMVWLSSSICL